MKVFFAVGSVLAGLGVIAGAFGTHALEGSLSQDSLESFRVAVRYQLLHAIALLLVAWAGTEWPGSLSWIAGGLFITGILLFSGSIYILVLSEQTWVGPITPIGGLALIAGWFLLALHVIL